MSNAAYIKSYVEESLHNLGFSQIVTWNYGSDSPSQGSVGVALARKKVIENNQVKNLVAVIIRGTVGGLLESEWVSNLFSQSLVGIGEYHANFKSSMDDIKGYVETYLNNIDDPVKVWVTGHSRAAAVGNLLTAEYLNPELGQSSVYSYLFATPNVKKSVTAAANIHNFENDYDLVTKMPPQPDDIYVVGGVVIPLPDYFKYGVHHTFNIKDNAAAQAELYKITGIPLDWISSKYSTQAYAIPGVSETTMFPRLFYDHPIEVYLAYVATAGAAPAPTPTGTPFQRWWEGLSAVAQIALIALWPVYFISKLINS